MAGASDYFRFLHFFAAAARCFFFLHFFLRPFEVMGGAEAAGVGAGLTEIAIASLSLSVPLLTANCTFGKVPAWLALGIQEKVRVAGVKMAPAGRFVAEKASVLNGSGSVAETVKVRLCPAWTDLLPIGSRTGGCTSKAPMSQRSARPPLAKPR